MFKCQECGRKFRTVKSAYRASLHGCPGCGGVDVDLDESPQPVKAPARKALPRPSDGYFGEERDPLQPTREERQTEAGYDKLAGGWIG